MGKFCTGQRWISETEPELGMGKVANADNRFVEIHFCAGEKRTYAAASAPLRRVRFKAGDSIQRIDGKSCIVQSVAEESTGGLIVYHCGKDVLREDELADTVVYSSPDKRLLAGIVDASVDFDLRSEILTLQTGIRQSPVKGFVGGRIDLLPHQLFIAHTVSSRKLPRALLADETGLGKTIEACLILHRLIVTGSVERALVLVPEPLVHQWFVELLRKFNLSFRLFTKEYVREIDLESGNPFLEQQFSICSVEEFSGNPKVGAGAVTAEWDLVVVDEAHHIALGSKAYTLLAELALKSPGLLLITATPEQFGREGHFARLQLLDPNRYTSFETYRQESERLQKISGFIDSYMADNGVNPDMIDPEDLQIPITPELLELVSFEPEGQKEPVALKAVSLARLIDLYAIGRVQFRNTRRAIRGFPVRNVEMISLEAADEQKEMIGNELQLELCGTNIDQISISRDDPRVIWLAELIRERSTEKVLVICRSKEKATSIQRGLQYHVKVDIALFHEDMTIIQADRSAAWFSEDQGARVLVSSDIGSEGRNFQFCSNLVLFDLPYNPELLEQRIGRLDRIGQRASIWIFVPFVQGTPQEVLARWYHESLNAFSMNVPAAGAVFEEIRSRLEMILKGKGATGEVHSFIKDSRELCVQLTEEISRGRDRLLEISSFQPQKADALLEQIRFEEKNRRADALMQFLFRKYGVALEDAGDNRYALLTEYVTDHAFPLPRQERPVITYDRQTALFRDNIEFLSIDHPMVLGAMELFLSSENGTSAYVLWQDSLVKELALESLFVLECTAPSAVNADRFLPPIPLRVVVNHSGQNVTQRYQVPPVLVNGSINKLLSNLSVVRVISEMLRAGQKYAGEMAEPVIAAAGEKMSRFYEQEITRLEQVRIFGGKTIQNEISILKQEEKELTGYLSGARVRLDSIRLIKRG